MTKPSQKTAAHYSNTQKNADENLVALEMVPRFLIARSGLKYLEANPADLERLVRARMADLQITNETEYLAFLQDREKGEKEFNLLAKELTVGETYFFRHREQFEAVKRVVPELLGRKAVGQSLKIWSAACSNGAELYSLSILLKDNFSAMLGDAAPLLVGTDINSDSLDKANAGVYEEWSLRGVSDSDRDKYFERNQKKSKIRDQYRQGVTFIFHNLASDPIPSAAHNLFGFDIIFLRNILIYFDPKTLSTFLGNIAEAMVPGGYLAVAPAEVGPDFEKWFEPVLFPGSLLYRKPLLPNSVGRKSEKMKVAPVAAVRTIRTASDPEAANQVTLDAAMAGANSGKLSHSKHLLETLIKNDSMNFEAHHYLGLVNYNLGDTSEAEKNFRRVLYLRRDFFPAQFHLAMIYRKVGDLPEATKILERIEAKLANQAPSEMIYAREELRVEDALTMVRFALQAADKK